MLISPKPFQVQFAVAQQHLHQFCMGEKDVKLSLRDQTSVTAYHRGCFLVLANERAQGPDKSQTLVSDLGNRIANQGCVWHLTPLASTPLASNTDVSVFLVKKLFFLAAHICLALLISLLFFLSFSTQKAQQNEAISTTWAPNLGKTL